jgi:glycosyltransferase involved in cell wall biosynthesis
MLTAVIAVALGAAWLGTISMRSTKDGNRNSYLSRGLRIASLGMQTARASLVMTLEKADVAFFVRKANRMGITCWWMPIGMYSGLAHVNGRKIITFADFSPREFPSMILDQPVMSKRGEEMAVALDSSDVIVCLSEHVATHHLPALLPSPKGRVLVIPPGPPNRREKSAENHSHGIAVLTERLKEDYPSSRATIADWWTMPTIVIPTQNRPYKNLHTIVRAVRILNVERFLRVRVIFTCHPEQMKMGDFVENLGCNSFIEFLPNLDDETLDLVIEHSSLAVSPSLFEGSLPYTFYEAVSLGTPCLLADIPVTRAATKGHDAFRQRSVFDPHHPQSVADAIEGCLEDLEGLKILQSLFLADYYDEHSWPRTAERYWRAFDETGMSEQPIKKKLGRG